VSLRAPAAVLVLALATACAETGSPWQKAGSDPETQKSDLGSCQTLAHQTYARQAPVAPPTTLGSAIGGAHGGISPMDTRIKQQQMVDSCMREKGYRFEPPVAR
jgi:hypothetical protein